MTDASFAALLTRVRAGDAQAAEELVRRCEPTLRVVVRCRLTDSALRRQFDSMDICQSVLSKFFVGVAAGLYQLESQESLHKLLITMALNKLRNLARRPPSQEIPAGQEPVDQGPTPSQVAIYDELLDKLRSGLSAEERQLAELRVAGRSWAEIAAQVGGQPDALRMQYTRAMERVLRALGLET